MSHQNKERKGCGCGNIPISLVILILGGGYWLFTQRNNLGLSNILPNNQQLNIPFLTSKPTTSATPVPTLTSSPAPAPTPTPSVSSTATTQPNPIQTSPTPQITPSPAIQTSPTPQVTPSPTIENKTNINKIQNSVAAKTPWEKKVIRGIYLSRYYITNNANEKTIRERVRFYHSQGINTIIHGVWGNGCTMYNSEVMQQTLGYKSCPNKFQNKWLDWLIDEAHKQGMEVHAYFEKGIKIDKNSPIFDLAIARKWVVPGVDKTYSGIEHYVLDVEIPEVANFFKNILVEFVEKYPKVDAVQWDDYLGYHAELPGKVDRTAKLTNLLQEMIGAMKKANPSVSFDICHHNPYWAKRYFAADWEKWNVDRAFIQAYSEKNFKDELNYVKKYHGIAITDKQFHRLPELIEDQEIKSILVFPLSGKPEETAANLKKVTQKKN
ncbi:MAG: family 10 glycosylhydrolase [Calothrix sp. MO_167.B42]|nr:family 10 glycosylhydrolase [Calothrix sp. MO_167.B42]